MVTTFVAKVSRIKNNKEKGYYIHRINLPVDVVERLGLKKEDYLLINAKKAEWYHMLDWSKMNQTLEKLPSNIRKQLEADGMLDNVKSPKQNFETYFAGVKELPWITAATNPESNIRIGGA